ATAAVATAAVASTTVPSSTATNSTPIYFPGSDQFTTRKEVTQHPEDPAATTLKETLPPSEPLREAYNGTGSLHDEIHQAKQSFSKDVSEQSATIIPPVAHTTLSPTIIHTESNQEVPHVEPLHVVVSSPTHTPVDDDDPNTIEIGDDVYQVIIPRREASAQELSGVKTVESELEKDSYPSPNIAAQTPLQEAATTTTAGAASEPIDLKSVAEGDRFSNDSDIFGSPPHSHGFDSEITVPRLSSLGGEGEGEEEVDDEEFEHVEVPDDRESINQHSDNEVIDVIDDYKNELSPRSSSVANVKSSPQKPKEEIPKARETTESPVVVDEPTTKVVDEELYAPPVIVNGSTTPQVTAAPVFQQEQPTHQAPPPLTTPQVIAAPIFNEQKPQKTSHHATPPVAVPQEVEENSSVQPSSDSLTGGTESTNATEAAVQQHEDLVVESKASTSKKPKKPSKFKEKIMKYFVNSYEN
ncbi:hypothetical protein G210_2356, partial [Candida maltosa Xu316]